MNFEYFINGFLKEAIPKNTRNAFKNLIVDLLPRQASKDFFKKRNYLIKANPSLKSVLTPDGTEQEVFDNVASLVATLGGASFNPKSPGRISPVTSTANENLIFNAAGRLDKPSHGLYYYDAKTLNSDFGDFPEKQNYLFETALPKILKTWQTKYPDITKTLKDTYLQRPISNQLSAVSS